MRPNNYHSTILVDFDFTFSLAVDFNPDSKKKTFTAQETGLLLQDPKPEEMYNSATFFSWAMIGSLLVLNQRLESKILPFSQRMYYDDKLQNGAKPAMYEVFSKIFGEEEKRLILKQKDGDEIVKKAKLFLAEGKEFEGKNELLQAVCVIYPEKEKSDFTLIDDYEIYIENAKTLGMKGASFMPNLEKENVFAFCQIVLERFVAVYPDRRLRDLFEEIDRIKFPEEHLRAQLNEDKLPDGVTLKEAIEFCLKQGILETINYIHEPPARHGLSKSLLTPEQITSFQKQAKAMEKEFATPIAPHKTSGLNFWRAPKKPTNASLETYHEKKKEDEEVQKQIEERIEVIQILEQCAQQFEKKKEDSDSNSKLMSDEIRALMTLASKPGQKGVFDQESKKLLAEIEKKYPKEYEKARSAVEGRPYPSKKEPPEHSDSDAHVSPSPMR